MREYRETFNNADENRLDKSRDNALSTDNLVNQIRQAIQGTLGVATYSVDSVLHTVLNLDIDKFCNFNDKNYALMMRLMYVNLLQSSTTLGTVGTSVVPHGISTNITSAAQAYSYTAGLNYTEEFAKTDPQSTESNINTTRYQDRGDSHRPAYDYDNHGQLYNGYTEPMYPDELGTLSPNPSEEGQDAYFQTWQLDGNRDSILWKTKKLCNDGKFNTIISRFGTRADADANSVPIKGEVGHPVYGMSHGRNLLTKEAEDAPSTSAYMQNGYNNPYCRVWTHHHQYNQVRRMIRPFTETSTDGSSRLVSIEEWHSKMPFRAKGVDKYDEGGEVGFGMSVLQDNGFVNITPKFKANGDQHPSGNIHTKQCMFSIENLAWKDYSPYEFEQNLSWEQRGPLGGRIMWFPPYGLSFNETSQVKWNSHSFIGRGEDVYTYVNTTRRGSLNFMMVVDNPSIINYFKGRTHSPGGDVKDTDILRFFAGCDPFLPQTSSGASGNDGNGSSDGNDASIDSSTKSNIHTYKLFDEYVKPKVSEIREPKPPKPDPVEPPTPDPEETETVKINFMVFYPNNYSGCYDRASKNSEVDAILYLLQGKVAQKDDTLTSETKDLPLTIDMDETQLTNNSGAGYEMSKTGVTNDSNLDRHSIKGHQTTWIQAKRNNIREYRASSTKKWYYRIDGEYKIPSGSSNVALETCNYYDQTLPNLQNYMDEGSRQLNYSSATVVSKLGLDSETTYSLAEMAWFLYNRKGQSDKLTNCTEFSESHEKIEKLAELFDSYEISSVSCVGWSNSHGRNASSSINQSRNDHLSIERANTVKDWLEQFDQFSSVDIEVDTTTSQNQSSTQVNPEDRENESGMSAKIYRAAQVTIEFTKTSTVSVSETEQQDPETHNNVSENIDDPSTVDGRAIVNDPDDTEDTELVGYDLEEESYDRGEGNDNHASEYHDKRYDKEYFFFNKIKETDPLVWDKLMDKIQYFDPAFHSMTPEGFTDRLSFLHQCTRQGDTIGASDSKAQTANNLAFGRPPFCVLRLGDFYNTKIIIENVTINYDPLQWDLNAEGIGVQPLLANITLSIVFIGGSDIGGPIDRLQNAMSFNYYANQRFYDNRADRVKYGHNPEYTNFSGIEKYEAHNSVVRTQAEIDQYNEAKQRQIDEQERIRREAAEHLARKRNNELNPMNRMFALNDTSKWSNYTGLYDKDKYEFADIIHPNNFV